MGSIADLFFTGRLDDGPLQVDAKKSGDKAGQTLGKSMSASIKKSSSELKGGLLGGLGLAGGIGIANLAANAVSGVTDAIFSSIDAASDLNETISKSDQIFGMYAGSVKEWGDTAADEFGQSKRAALDTASTFAGLFSTVGLALSDATDKAKTLTKLGSDLASFFNTDVATATAALRSGLSGESEPLRQFNVFLSETAVAAKAAQLGLKKVNGQFTEGQKVTARYAIIMDQTTSAQGDFAKTSDGLANKQRILSARLEDASAQIGEVLLPVMLELADVVLDDLVPALQKIAPAAKTGFDAFGVVVDGLAGWKQAVESVAGAELDLIDDTRGAIPHIYDAGTAAQATSRNFDKMRDRAEKVADATTGATSQIAESAEDMAKRAARSFGQVVSASLRLRNAMLEDAKAIVNGYYDKLIAADQLAATQAEITAQQKIANSHAYTQKEIDDAHTHAKTTEEIARADAMFTQNEINDAKARLHELAKDNIQYLEDLATAGGSGSVIVQKAMTEYLQKLKTAHGAERKAIWAEIYALEVLAAKAYEAQKRVQHLGSDAFHGSSGASEDDHRASGGPVTAGQSYIVGEQRPELFVPSVDGRILPRVPSQSWMSQGGGGDTYNVNLLDRMEVRSVRDIGAGLRMLGEQGHLARKKAG